MASCCAFLRGINVNGIAIKMAELKAAFIEMGYADAKTLLATGNVVFSLAGEEQNPEDAKGRIERELSNRFGYEAHVFLRGEREIREVIEAAETIDVPEGCHLYWFVCEDKELPLELERRFQELPAASEERFWARENGAFWIVPKGSTLSSDFGSKVLGSKKFKDKLTSRNINTIGKIAQAMGQ